MGSNSIEGITHTYPCGCTLGPSGRQCADCERTQRTVMAADAALEAQLSTGPNTARARRQLLRVRATVKRRFRLWGGGSDRKRRPWPAIVSSIWRVLPAGGSGRMNILIASGEIEHMDAAMGLFGAGRWPWPERRDA